MVVEMIVTSPDSSGHCYPQLPESTTPGDAGSQREPALNIEFDGTTVLCRVCGDKASGFHYGVHSCEGCKGFFRRSIQQKIQYRPCTKNQQCSILRINRNRCQYCRLKKCIAVGMSRDAVRFGRVPKREKARILAAMQQSSNSRSLEKAVSAELEDEQRLLATVVRAHLDTCDFTRDKVEPMLARAREQPSYTACPPTLACPLNPNPQPLTGQQELLQDFSKRFSPAIRGVVEFAKRIPGFSLLAQDDQVTLLKAGVFEVLLVRLACMFDAQTSTMICLNGQLLKRDAIHNSSNARFLMDSMFDFAERVNSLRLSDAEIGLFCSVVVIAADRPGLRNTDLIDKMHNKLKTALQLVMAQNRPGHPDLCHELMKKVPDLRTLNTLHSEKLLAFKMTEQQQQLQQQLQQQTQWGAALAAEAGSTAARTEDEGISTKSPAGSSSWSSSSDVTMDEAKSPLGSVSSTESMCSGEMVSLADYHHQLAAAANTNASSHHPHHHHHHQQQQQQHHHHHQLQQHNHHHQQQQQQQLSSHASSAPLLAATLAGGLCPHRHRANSGSTSSGDDELASTAHLVHNGLTITPVLRPSTAASSSSSSATGMQLHQQQLHRFGRKLDSPSDSGIESGTDNKLDVTVGGSGKMASSSSAPTSLCSSPRSSLEDHTEDSKHHIVEDMPVLKRVLQAPPLYDTNSLMDEAYKPHKKFRALRNKDSAEAEPSCSSLHSQPLAQPARSPAPGSGCGATSPHGSLSSTHSTLARSLMEGPRMTAEQQKRTDIIHNYIMRGENSPASTASSATDMQFSPVGASCPYSAGKGAGPSASIGGAGPLLVCATAAPTYGLPPHSLQHQQAATIAWSSAGAPSSYGTSVITTTTGRRQSPTPTYVLVPNSTSRTPPPAVLVSRHQSEQQSQQTDFPRIYFHPQSPQSSSSTNCTSVSPHHQLQQARRTPPASPCTTSASGVQAPQHQAKLVELQVDIAADAPLNLSKKSPSPSPRHHVKPVPMEA